MLIWLAFGGGLILGYWLRGLRSDREWINSTERRQMMIKEEGR